MSLSKIKRRVIFYVCVLIFLIITPVVILYSLGYYYNLKNQTLEKTGGIFLKSSNASGYQVFINGSLTKETSFIISGALLTNLDQGEYAVEIKKEGFVPWTKKIEVKKELVTEIRNILLLPDLTKTPGKTELEATTSLFALLSISPDENKVVIRDQKNGEIYLIPNTDFEKNLLKPFFPKHNILQTFWDKNSKRILLRELGNSWHLIELTDITSQNIFKLPEKITSLSASAEEHQPSRTASYAFDDSDFNKLFALNENGALLSINYKSGPTTSIKMLLEKINALGFGEDKILALFENGFFAQAGLDGKNIKVLGRKGFFLGTEPAKMNESKNGDIYLTDSSGGLFFIKKDEIEIEPIDGAVLGAEFDADAKKLLYWKENELHVLFLKDESYQPYRKNGAHIIIPAPNEKIKKAVFYGSDHEHIIVLTEKGIFISDIDERGGFFVKKIIDGHVQNFIYSVENQKLLWSDGNAIKSLEL